MTRNILALSILCLSLFIGLGGCNQKDDAPRVGVVDTEKVFQNSKLAQQGMAYIEGVSKQFSERLDKMQEEVSADPENQELMKQMQAELMRLQGDFEARQVEIGNKINKLFEDVLAEYREKNNLDVILPVQTVLSSRPGVDVTDAIVTLLDSKTIDFGALDAAFDKGMAPPAAAGEPAPEAAPAPAGESAPQAASAPEGGAETK